MASNTTIFLILIVASLGLTTPKTWCSEEYAPWIKNIMAIYPKTTPALQLQKTLKSAYASARASESQDPITISSEIKKTTFQADPTSTQYNKAASLEITPSASFSLRNSLSLTFTADFYNDRYDLPISLAPSYIDPSTGLQPSPPADTTPLSLTAKLEYDLSKGGKSGIAETQAQYEIAQAMQTAQSTLSSITDLRVQFLAASTDYYILLCKIKTIESARELVNNMVTTGALQVKTNTLSSADFLNFKNLEDSFASQTVDLNSSLNLTKENFRLWGEPIKDLIEKLNTQNVFCETKIDLIKKRIKNSIPQKDSLPEIANIMPSTKAASFNQNAAEMQLLNAKATNRMSIKPFVFYSKNKLSGATETLYNFGGGVNLSWNLPFNKGEEQIISNSNNFSAAELATQKTKFSNTSKLLGIFDQIDAQLKMLDILESTNKNSAELLNILKTQRAIGKTDSMMITDAYLKYINSQHSLLQTWGTLEKLSFELNEYSSYLVKK